MSTKPHDSDRDTQFLLQDIWVQVIKFITFPKLHILMQTILNDNSALLTLLKKFYSSPSLIQLKIKTSPCISITSQLFITEHIFSGKHGKIQFSYKNMVNERRKKVLQEVNLCHIIKNTKGGKNQIKSSMKTSSIKSIN